MSPAANTRDNRSLTGIRGVAALWVALFHFYPWVSEVFQCRPRGEVPFVRDGFLGVDLFFMLSGYVLTASYGDRLGVVSLKRVMHFLTRRAFRILPMHWAVLLLLAALVAGIPDFARPPGAFSTINFIRSALMMQGTLFGSVHSWNQPTWSIDDECVAYLLFPLMAPLLVGIRDATLCLLGASLCLLGLSVFVRYGVGVHSLDVVYPGGLERCLCEFITGALAFKAWQLETAFFRSLAMPIMLLGFLILAGAIAHPSHFGLFAPFGMLCIVLATGAESSDADLLFGNPVSLFFGTISYSLYLLHMTVFSLVSVPGVLHLLARYSMWERVLVAVLLWCVLILVSWIGYRVIEKPFRAFGRSLSRSGFASVRRTPRGQAKPPGA